MMEMIPMNEQQQLAVKQFAALMNVENAALAMVDPKSKENMLSFPLADIASVGAEFSSIAPCIQKIAAGGEQLYKVVGLKPGEHIFEVKANPGQFVTAKGAEGVGVTGQARLVKAGKTVAGGTSMSMMFVAVAIMAINKTLKEIVKNQKDIISFLEIDKQSQLKADLSILTDVLNDYQYNWENQQYKQNREMQVLDIKRSSEQNVLFYKERISSQLDSIQKFIHLETQKQLNDIQVKFHYYKLAVYLYAYAAFLDIMLLDNYDETYLNAIKQKIQKYLEEYAAFYDECQVKVEKYVGTSAQSRTLQAASAAAKFTGKMFGKAASKIASASKEVVDFRKLDIEGKLNAGGEKLDQMKTDAVSKTTDSFAKNADSGITLFVQNINIIDCMHNHPDRMLFDGEQIYLPSAESEEEAEM